jgi:predicted nucleotidyltransferase
VALKRGTSVWVYGSVARGDADLHSDVDVLMVGDEIEWGAALMEDAEIASHVRRGHRPALMRFSWKELDAMWGYGSLFLHHVRLEGRPVKPALDDPLGRLLSTLPPYRRATQEIQALGIVLRDVGYSLPVDHSPKFELAVIATALRHAFILGCYVSGRPDFGRTTPFHTLGPELQVTSRDGCELGRLYGFRLYQQGRASAPFDATTEDVREWLHRADTLLAAIRRRVDDWDRAMSCAGSCGSPVRI